MLPISGSDTVLPVTATRSAPKNGAFFCPSFSASARSSASIFSSSAKDGYFSSVACAARSAASADAAAPLPINNGGAYSNSSTKR